MHGDPGRASGRPSARRLALAMLVAAYTLNFVDRQIIGILAGPIKTALALSDTQLGLLGGVAFALFYATIGIPFASLADRTSRSGVITAAIGLWSGFTALCGAATGFWSLFLARVGVGVGEAGGVAPAYALIADLYPKGERARALAVFAFGSPMGSALGIFLGGWIATRFDWRVAFITLGVAGLLFAPLFRAMVREPARAAPSGAGHPPRVSGAVPARATFPSVLRTLSGIPAFWWLALGAASTSLVGYGLLFWLPSFFTRSHGLTLLESARVYGTIVLVGGLVGTWSGGWLADRLGQRSRKWYGLIPAIAVGAAAPLYAIGTLSHSLGAAALVFVVPHALGLMWLGPVTAAVQHVVPSEMRATASAIFLFVLNLIGIGGGALFFGSLSDYLASTYGTEALRYAILAGLGFYLLASGLFVLAARRLEVAWRD